jgi:hypothetical protein
MVNLYQMDSTEWYLIELCFAVKVTHVAPCPPSSSAAASGSSGYPWTAFPGRANTARVRIRHYTKDWDQER